MTTVKQISREDWVKFCDSFSRKHQGWLVTIEVDAASGGKHVIARDVPLEGVVADVDGDGHVTILIIVGKMGMDQATHAIPNPTHIRLEQTSRGADKALDIESDRETTHLRFRVAALPAEVDGV